MATVQPWHVGTPEELICSSGNGTRVPLTGPSPVAKIVLNGDLLVVLACQYQPLWEVSSPSLKAQNWSYAFYPVPGR